MKRKGVPLGYLLVCGLSTGVLAAEARLPEGWTKEAEGQVVHMESGLSCPTMIESYTFQELDGPRRPNILGVCKYTDADGRVGEIRLRRYVAGVGETSLAIRNDDVLMGAAPSGAPPGAKMTSTFRMGPGPRINRRPTRQQVQTVLRRGLLVDCVEIQTEAQAEQNSQNSIGVFTNVCTDLREG
jgi:hypothetical protein